MPKPDPLSAFRFLVEWEDDGAVAAAFASFSGVRMQKQTLDYRFGSDSIGRKRYIPTLTEIEPVTLEKGVIGDSQFLTWVLDAMPTPEAGPKDGGKTRTINVVALDQAGRRAVCWTLTDCLPIGYALGQMDGISNTVLTESLTFQVGGVKRTVENQYIIL